MQDHPPVLCSQPSFMIVFLCLKETLTKSEKSQKLKLPTGGYTPSLHFIARICCGFKVQDRFIHGNVEDVILSDYHFAREALKLRVEDASFEKAFDELCEGISFNGPYWDHILGYWKASIERSGDILFLKYEDLKRDPTGNVKRLAEFIGYPFSVEEMKAGVVDDIIKMCSLEHLNSLDVNQSRKCRPEGNSGEEKRLFFRKHEDGYFTNEMKLKIHKLMDQKLSGTGLVVTK
ncbi:hypothetical protein R6Q57_006358 [Mikania cordata]